jgi:hypothetical protein
MCLLPSREYEAAKGLCENVRALLVNISLAAASTSKQMRVCYA